MRLPSTLSLSSMGFPLVEPVKARHRPTAIAFLAILSLLAYAFLIGSTLDLRAINAQKRNVDSAFQSFRAAALLRHKQRLMQMAASVSPHRDEPFKIPSDDELGALTGFLASLASNTIPPTIEPDLPLDPQIVLDFDTRGPTADEELREVLRDTWHRNPVVVYCTFHSPISREVKGVLQEYNLRPSPTIFDVDQRADSLVLFPLLRRLVPGIHLPIIIVGGQVIGSIDSFRALHESGELKRLITVAGAEVNGGSRKGKKH